MKAKLIKKDGHYFLEVEPNTWTPPNRFHSIIANTLDKKEGDILQLSIKNCQAIERGYDLDELADIYSHEACEDMYEQEGLTGAEWGWETALDFKKGFQKCLELMGDKKFSEEDVKNLIDNIHSIYEDGFGVATDDKKQHAYKLIQSLQQSEWNVEIVEVRQRCHLSIGDWVSEDENGEFPMSINGAFGYRYIPKLDADGCLILKLKSE